MVDTSAQYGLTNPAFTEDIGLSNLDKMLPMAPASFGGMGYIPGITGTMSGTKIKGQLTNDIYQPTRKERDKSLFKKLFATAGIIIAGVLCYKGAKKSYQQSKIYFKRLKQNSKNKFQVIDKFESV